MIEETRVASVTMVRDLVGRASAYQTGMSG